MTVVRVGNRLNCVLKQVLFRTECPEPADKVSESFEANERSMRSSGTEYAVRLNACTLTILVEYFESYLYFRLTLVNTYC